MILRLLYLMQCWAWLCMVGVSFTTCMKGQMGDLYLLRDDLVMLMTDMSSYITGKKKEIDVTGNIIAEKSCAKNFAKAHALFSDVERKLTAYPKITKYPISKSILNDMQATLNELKQDIEALPDGSDKNQFIAEYNHLDQYIASLMAKKDV